MEMEGHPVEHGSLTEQGSLAERSMNSDSAGQGKSEAVEWQVLDGGQVEVE